MPKSLHADIVAAKNEPHPDSLVVDMLILYPNPTTTLYFTSYHESISYNSQTWQPLPFAVGDWDEDDRGNLPDTQLGIKDPTHTLGRLIDSNPEFMDTPLELFKYFKDAGQAAPSTYWSIEDSTTNLEGDLVLRIGSQEPFYSSPFPRERVARNRCRHTFKGTACGYASSDTTCSQDLLGANGCVAKSNESRFGGCPASR